MKNYFAVLLLVLAVAFAGCDEGGKQLTGSVVVTPVTAVVGNTLTAVYGGPETITWRWFWNGNPIAGATRTTYTPTEAGEYTASANADGFAPKTGNTVIVTAVPAPPLSGNVTVTPTTAVVNTKLTAAYSGTETVTWQWNKDGSPIAGATGADYTPTAAGSYTATASAPGFSPKTSIPMTVTDTRQGAWKLADWQAYISTGSTINGIPDNTALTDFINWANTHFASGGIPIADIDAVLADGAAHGAITAEAIAEIPPTVQILDVATWIKTITSYTSSGIFGPNPPPRSPLLDPLFFFAPTQTEQGSDVPIPQPVGEMLDGSDRTYGDAGMESMN